MALHHTISALIFLLLAIFAMSAAADNIQDACSKTKEEHLCIESLRSYPQSKDADFAKLVVLFLQFTKETAFTYNEMLRQQDRDIDVKTALLGTLTCINEFQARIMDSINKFVEARSTVLAKQYNDAQYLVVEVSDGAKACANACQSVKNDPKVADIVKYADNFSKLVTISNNLITALIDTKPKA